MRIITILCAAALLLTGCAAGSGRQGTEVVVSGVGPTAAVAAGTNATFVMTVSNTGPSDASNIKLIDNVGNQLQLQSITCTASGGATCPSPISVDMLVPFLPNGGKLTFNVNVQLAQGASGVVSNSMVATLEQEIDPTRDSAAVSATVMSVVTNIVVSGQGPATPIVSGSTAVFVMTVTNNGPDAATAFNVHDTVGTGLTLLGITCAASGGAACPPSVTVLTPIATLPSGGVLTFTVTTRVDVDVVGTVSNGMTVDVKTNPNPSANTFYATATVVAAGVSVTGQAPSGPLADGASGAFTMTVINTGPGAAGSLAITNSLSAGITASGAITCAANGGAVCPSVPGSQMTVPGLPVNGVLTFTVPFTVNAGTNGQVSDTMTVSSSAGTRVGTAVVGAGNSFVVVSETGDPQVAAGGTAVFTAVVTNTGTSAVSNIEVSYALSGQALPSGTTAVISCTTSAADTLCPATLGAQMTLPLLNPGRSVTFTFSVPVPASAAGQGSITNTVTVSAAGSGTYQASYSTSLINANSGTYQVFAADGNQYTLNINFQTDEYTISGTNGVSIAASFTEDSTGGGYTVSGTRKFRVYTNLIVGGEDFSPTSNGTVLPYIAVRVFSSSLQELAQFFGGLYDVVTLDTATGATAAGTARVSGNVLTVCSSPIPPQSCPAASLQSYALSVNGNVYTGTSTSNPSAAPFVFQLAIIGASSAMVSAGTPQGGTSPQLIVGLPDAPALAGGTSYGASTTGDWVTVTLTPDSYSYTGVPAGSGSASLSQINASGGPFSLLQGTVGANSSPVYVMQSYPLAVAFGACASGNSNCVQVTVP